MKEHLCDRINTSKQMHYVYSSYQEFECFDAPAHLLYTSCYLTIATICPHVVESCRSSQRLSLRVHLLP